MKQFTVTREHLTLLRNAYVRWDDSEFGVPGLDSKRPYGNSDVLGDIHRLIGIPVDKCNEDGEWPAGVARRYERIHSETQTALQIVLATGDFTPGIYAADDYDRNWRRVL